MKTDFGMIFWIHLILIIALWTSPFWLDWKLIIFGGILYSVQLMIFGDCILTRKQFGTKKRGITFYYYYLKKMGFNVSSEGVRKFADRYSFPIILITAIIIQEVLNFKVFFKIIS
jgi:hypothetical protein